MESDVTHLIGVVPPQDIAGYWPRVEGYIERAAEFHPFLSVEDVRGMLESGHAFLMVKGNRDECVGCAVLEVVCYPRVKVLNVLFLGGCRGFIREHIDGLGEAMRLFGQAFGCTMGSVYGRPGWKRFLERNGFRTVKTLTAWCRL